VEFRILGPLEVLDNGRVISIRGRKRQALLALLILNSGEVVARDRLIDELWGDDPPPTAAKTLQVHVSRLRRELGDVLVTRGGGYLLAAQPEQVDLARFDRLVTEGRRALAEGQPEHASELLREGLALWRGAPLAELADEPFARAEIGRLEDARLDAIEDRAEAELALGRLAEAIRELEPLVARHPYRERLHELLMLALYRAGRQADALAAYRDARRVLVDELGLEPGARLRRLHTAILAQDPALERPEAAPPPSPERPAVPSARRLWPVAGALAALVLVVLAVALLATREGGSSSRPLTDDSHAVAVIDPATNRVTTAASVGTNPGPLAFEPKSRSVWVGNVDDESVTRIDLDPVRTGKTIAIGDRPTGLAAGKGGVWVTAARGGQPFVTARRIDPRFDSAGRPVKVATLPGEDMATVAHERGALWVAPSLGLLTRLDAATGRKLDRGIEPASSPTTVAADANAVWTADAYAALVSRVDPATGVVQPIRVAEGVTDIALTGDAAWVTQALDDSLARIDASTGALRDRVPVGRRPVGVTVGAGAVWVANSGDGTVSRVDPRSGRVTDTIEIGASPQDLLFADGRLWVSVRPRRTEPDGAPGGTIRMETTVDVDYLDPALGYQPFSFQILHASCAQLLNYPAEPGATGTRLIPEVAEALPEVSRGGRAYTFTIRRGFRFAPTGEPVTARSMKYTIERSLNPRMPGPAAGMVDIAGVTASGRRLTISLARPSPNMPAVLALPPFCAVPTDTPIEPAGLRKVPSAGPYYVATHRPGEEIVLRRNPSYPGPRPNRPDEIRMTVAAGQAKSVARVEGGEVDYTPVWSNADTARRLLAVYGPGSPSAEAGRQRLFATEELQLDQLIFNTSRAPFSSARLRQAVNYALDRRALARQGLYADLPASPTDQYLPPGMPGFHDARIYPFRPDLAKARRLLGGERYSVVLYSESAPTHVRFAEIVRANLRAIGIDVEIKQVGVSLYERVARPGEPFDLALIGWVADHPDPYDFLRQLDGRTIRSDGNFNYAHFNDPEYNRRLDAALRLRSPAREIALGRLDVNVARTEAPWAALANERGYDFFSARIGCQAYNPAFGIELGGLCIRRGE
jgi:DNA-binding SARP family transcriptional activator/ABC-type transport system substrate-binding protein/DNA-binding beta-propeller fold protein YncE